MRKSILLAPLLLAACGGGEGGGEATENKAAEVAGALTPGLYEIRSEVTAFDQLDQGQPKIDTPVGTTASEQVCVEPGDRPISNLFTGAEFDCEYHDYYGRNGRLNHTLNCSREGNSGNVGVTVDGTFTADSFEVQRTITTSFVEDGDVRTMATVTGRRVGDCPAGAEGAAEEGTETAE